MNHEMNYFELLVVSLLVIWIVGLGFAFLFQNPRGYIGWTRRSLTYIWRRGWQMIVGLLLGYILSGRTVF